MREQSHVKESSGPDCMCFIKKVQSQNGQQKTQFLDSFLSSLSQEYYIYCISVFSISHALQTSPHGFHFFQLNFVFDPAHLHIEDNPEIPFHELGPTPTENKSAGFIL